MPRGVTINFHSFIRKRVRCRTVSGIDGKTADVFFSMKVYAKKQGIQDSIANGRVKKIVREPAEKEQEQSKRDRARELRRKQRDTASEESKAREERV